MAKLIGRKRIATIAGVGLSLAVAGGAFAYWTQSGSGTGSASAGTTSAITVNQTASISGLYPGGPAQTLSGTFTNLNSGKVYVGSVSAAITSGWSAQADANKPACTASDFTIVNPATVNAEISAGTGVGSWSGITIAMNNLATNQDNCKSVSPSLVYTSN